MSIDVRGRRTRYDNISVGNATGRELTIANTSVSPVERYGGAVGGTSTSAGGQWHTNIAVGVSSSNVDLENMTVGQDPVEEPGVTAGVS